MTIRVLLDASTSLARSAFAAALRECGDIELVDAGVSGSAPVDIDVLVLERRRLDDLCEPFSGFTQGGQVGVVAIDESGQSGSILRIGHRDWRFAPDQHGGLADAVRAAAGGR